ncbi:MAG: tyrosine-type recombinase/integrase [Xanthobacteraceae bacterium]
MAAYNRAIAERRTLPSGQLRSLITAYKQSDEFSSREPRTRADYLKQIEKIEVEFGDFPISALGDKRTRGILKAWRDRLAVSSRRQAQYAWTVLARILSVAKDRGSIEVNPCEKGGRIYRADRSDRVWSTEDEAQFYSLAPAHLHLALMLALWTGQRQGDLLRLPWSSYDGKCLRLRQRKTRRRVTIPVGAPLKAALDATAKRGPIILVTLDGRPWTEDGFRSSWGKACTKAGVEGVTFHDLRGSAVTRLGLVGCTEAEIAAITGLSLKDVSEILDAHYLSRDVRLAESAVRKLETGTENCKTAVKRSTRSNNDSAN